MEMKGRVACEMGSHELIITELLFESAFSDLEPPEVAAILSCMVFQQVSYIISTCVSHICISFKYMNSIMWIL